MLKISPKIGLVVFMLVIALLAACSQEHAPAERGRGEVPVATGLSAEEYAPGRAGELRQERIQLPWMAEPQLLTFKVIDGLAIVEGDIILGEVATSGKLSAQAIARSGADYRWPDATIPYTVDASLKSNGQVDNRITRAIQHWHDNTDIQLVERTNETDYVTFEDGDGCSADVGRQQGQQFIYLHDDCSVGNTIHEIGHTVGLWHEHTRSDRDKFVTIKWDNIIEGEEDKDEFKDNFKMHDDDGMDLCRYDYGSVMHYGERFFGEEDSSGNEKVTIEPKDPDATIGQRNGLSAGDLCGVRRLYPREATIWYQDQLNLTGKSEQADAFGNALASGDFNGDGIKDLIIGVKREDVGTIRDAGAANVLYGTRTGLREANNQIWTQASSGIKGVAEASDEFGTSLATGDFNGDGKDDVAIGVPDEAVGSVKQAGAVNIIYGSSSGLRATGNQIWSQDSSGIFGKPETLDLFGLSLASGDFNGDGVADLAIGAVREEVSGVRLAGMVHILYGSRTGGLRSTGSQAWHLGNLNIGLPLAEGQGFGAALAAGDFDDDGRDDLAIGISMATVDTINRAGAAAVLYGTPSGLAETDAQLWHQNSPDMAGKAETRDYFGSSLAVGDFDKNGRDDLAIGIPQEDIGDITDAGAVAVLYGGFGGLRSEDNGLWHQDSKGIKGRAEKQDRFGHSLVAGDFDGDNFVDLAVGLWSEDGGDTFDSGAINILFGSASKLSNRNQLWHQNSPGAAGVAESLDLFGAALAAGDYDGDGSDELAVGVPGEAIETISGAGAVNMIYFFD